MSYVCALPLTAVLVLLAARALAEPVKVTVRGGATIEARAAPRLEEIEVEGALRDDAGRPIPKADVRVTIDPPRGPSLPPVHPLGCAGHAVPRASGQELVATTDGTGRFCLRLAGTDFTGFLRLRYTGDRYHDASDVVRLRLEPYQASVDLRFFPEPRQLPLERRLHTVWVTASVDPRSERDELLTLELLFADRETPPERIGARAVRAGDRAQFEIPSQALGKPGPGQLIVRFAGGAGLQPAQRALVVERTAVVTLSSEGVRGGDAGARLLTVAAASKLGPVPSGAVEATVATRSVGVAPVSSGRARVMFSFPDRADGAPVPVTFRYLPDAPWWVAGDPLEVAVAPEPRSPWRGWPWIVSGLALTLWIARGWRRPRSADRGARVPSPPAPTGRAQVDLVERGPEGSGWRGVVLDAHDGHPIPNAALVIRVPSFGGEAPSVGVQTDGNGAFELAVLDRTREGSRLEVRAPFHVDLVRALPPPGRLSIALVQRRRALLDRLVAWARRAGGPWVSPGEPTPGEVARIGRRVGAGSVAGWAERLEEAAYGPLPVDEAREQAVRAHEPGSGPAHDGIR